MQFWCRQFYLLGLVAHFCKFTEQNYMYNTYCLVPFSVFFVCLGTICYISRSARFCWVWVVQHQVQSRWQVNINQYKHLSDQNIGCLSRKWDSNTVSKCVGLCVIVKPILAWRHVWTNYRDKQTWFNLSHPDGHNFYTVYPIYYCYQSLTDGSTDWQIVLQHRNYCKALKCAGLPIRRYCSGLDLLQPPSIWVIPYQSTRNLGSPVGFWQNLVYL